VPRQIVHDQPTRATRRTRAASSGFRRAEVVQNSDECTMSTPPSRSGSGTHRHAPQVLGDTRDAPMQMPELMSTQYAHSLPSRAAAA
jgi:hypothetical protein